MDLGDGRVGAFLVTTDPFTGTGMIYVIFIQEANRWLIDKIIEFRVLGGGGEDAEGTPAA